MSTPLNAKGGKKPSILNPSDKHATSEGTHGFITFAVEGDPAPEVEWYKVTESPQNKRRKSKKKKPNSTKISG